MAGAHGQPDSLRLVLLTNPCLASGIGVQTPHDNLKGHAFSCCSSTSSSREAALNQATDGDRGRVAVVVTALEQLRGPWFLPSTCNSSSSGSTTQGDSLSSSSNENNNSNEASLQQEDAADLALEALEVEAAVLSIVADTRAPQLLLRAFEPNLLSRHLKMHQQGQQQQQQQRGLQQQPHQQARSHKYVLNSSVAAVAMASFDLPSAAAAKSGVPVAAIKEAAAGAAGAGAAAATATGAAAAAARADGECGFARLRPLLLLDPTPGFVSLSEKQQQQQQRKDQHQQKQQSRSVPSHCTGVPSRFTPLTPPGYKGDACCTLIQSSSASTSQLRRQQQHLQQQHLQQQKQQSTPHQAAPARRVETHGKPGGPRNTSSTRSSSVAAASVDAAAALAAPSFLTAAAATSAATAALPGVSDDAEVGNALASWAAATAVLSNSSVHTPRPSSKARMNEEHALSSPRKKMHTTALRRFRHSTTKTSVGAAATAAPAAAADTCSTLQQRESRHTRSGKPTAARPATAVSPSDPTAALSFCRHTQLTSRDAALQQRCRSNRQELQQQQQPLMLQTEPGHEGLRVPVPFKDTRRQQQHMQNTLQQQQQQPQQHKRMEWRPRAAGVPTAAAAAAAAAAALLPAAAGAAKASDELECPRCASDSTSTVYIHPKDCPTSAAESRDFPLHSPSQCPPQGDHKEEHWGRRHQRQQQQQQHVQPEPASGLFSRSPRPPAQQQQRQQQLLLQPCRSSVPQQCGAAAAAAARQPSDGDSEGSALRQRHQQQLMLLERAQHRLPLQQQQQQLESQGEESPACVLLCSCSLETAAVGSGLKAAATKPAGGFPWKQLPVGLRLLVCNFLGEEELRALRAAGSAGLEAADHPHVWLLRCTRRWCPCLASTANRAAALPVGIPLEQRRRKRRKWHTEERQLFCAPAAAAAPGNESSDLNVKRRDTARPHAWSTSTAERIRPPPSYTSNSSSSSMGRRSGGHEVLWESWARHALNDEAYGFDYKRLFLDRNGWRPLGGALPRWVLKKRDANPPLVNTMDARQQLGCLYLASEAFPKSGNSPAAKLQVLSLHDLSVQRQTSVASSAINCLDLDKEVLVCGDDNGVVQIFNPFSLQLRGKHAAVGLPLLALAYGLRATQEVNDLRVCGAERQVLTVRTASRYPAGIDLIDLETGARRAVTPEKTDGKSPTRCHWIHAVDVDSPPLRCPYTSRSGAADVPLCCCSQSSSSGLRTSSLSNVFAIGESSGAGSFVLLRLDFRLDRPVVQQVPQSKRMLWPLRMKGHMAFVNAVFGPHDFSGRIHQVDLRMPASFSAGASSASWSLSPSTETDTSLAAPDGLLHLLPHKRVEDIRVFDGQLYVLVNDKKGHLGVVRFETEAPREAQPLCAVDTFQGGDWAEPLRLLLMFEEGWAATYGNYVTVGSMAGPAEGGPLPLSQSAARFSSPKPDF
ncbi:hypothetical protein Esti_005316 [Eimeria stiedai]